jgi:hypothetical protein
MQNHVRFVDSMGSKINDHTYCSKETLLIRKFNGIHSRACI